MPKVNITVDDPNLTEEQIKRIIEQSLTAVNEKQEVKKPYPRASDGSCGCSASERDICYMDYDCSYCRRCGGNWY